MSSSGLSSIHQNFSLVCLFICQDSFLAVLFWILEQFLNDFVIFVKEDESNTKTKNGYN